MDAVRFVPQVVVVGAGFGGITCARALRRAPVRITLIDRSNHHLFQPLLYQVATAGLSAADIASPIRSILRNQRNVAVVMGEVTGVDRANRCAQIGDKSIPFDYLVLATGARHSYFGHESWEEFAPGLKSIPDAKRIRERVLLAFEAAEVELDPTAREAYLTFVVVGGGPTGVEMAGAIAELAHRALAADFRRIDPKSARVVLIEAGPRVLATFPESLSQYATKSLRRLGVDVRTGSRVEEIDAYGVRVSGHQIAARTIVWAAGVVASSAGQWLGAGRDKAGRVYVNDRLNIDGDSHIFVVGDTAHLEENGHPLPGVAQVAIQQGRYVAHSILSRIGGQEPAGFKYRDKGNMATIGRSSAVADTGWFRLTGFAAWMAWLTVHIYYLIGFRNRLLVLIEWAWSYVTFQRGARLITDEPPPSVTQLDDSSSR